MVSSHYGVPGQGWNELTHLCNSRCSGCTETVFTGAVSSSVHGKPQRSQTSGIATAVRHRPGSHMGITTLCRLCNRDSICSERTARAVPYLCLPQTHSGRSPAPVFDQHPYGEVPRL